MTLILLKLVVACLFPSGSPCSYALICLRPPLSADDVCSPCPPHSWDLTSTLPPSTIQLLIFAQHVTLLAADLCWLSQSVACE